MVYNIYFGHSLFSEQYADELDVLLKEYPYFKHKPFHMLPADPVLTEGVDTALKMTIENKMRLCHAVIVLLDVYDSYSKWIDIETGVAKKLGIPVIAVSSSGQVQEPLCNQVTEVVGRDVSLIVGAVRKHAKL